MSIFFNSESCSQKLRITLNCTLTPPYTGLPNSSYTTVGNVERGKFQADPDIAGIGVLLAFFGVTTIAMVTSWMNIGLQVCSTLWLPNTEDLISSNQNKSNHYLFVSLIDRISEKTQSLLMACSDQQTLTSIAYTLYFGLSDHACEVSTYHYTILLQLMMVCCITLLLASTGLVKFWEGKTKAVLRILAGFTLVFLTFTVRWPSNQNSFLDSTHNDIFILPVTCLEQYNTNKDLRMHQSTMSWIILPVGLLSAITMTIDAILQVLRNRAKWMHEDWTKWRRSLINLKGKRWLILIVVYVLITFGSALGFLIYFYVRVFRMRAWLSSSGWLDPEEKNPESDIFSVGQALPTILFILPLFNLCSTWKPLIVFIFRYVFRKQRLLDDLKCKKQCFEHCSQAAGIHLPLLGGQP